MKYRSDKTVNLSASINQISGFVSLLILLAIIIATFIITLPVSASELDDFETAATTDNSDQKSDEDKDDDKKEEDDQTKDSKENYHHEDLFSYLFRKMFEAIINSLISAINEQAEMSFARIEGSNDAAANIEIRQTGEPTLPFIQMDTKYLYINPDITALDGCLEFGYAAFGFECRSTYFTEINPGDNLTLTQYHLLLRLSQTRSQEFGIGIGTIDLLGNEQNTGSSFTFPMKIYLNDSFGVKIKPTFNWINGNLIRDYDLSMVVSKRFGSLELGYRYFEVNGENLGGSYFGFVFHY